MLCCLGLSHSGFPELPFPHWLLFILQVMLPGPSDQVSTLLWAVAASSAFALQNTIHTLVYLFPPNGAQPGACHLECHSSTE